MILKVARVQMVLKVYFGRYVRTSLESSES